MSEGSRVRTSEAFAIEWSAKIRSARERIDQQKPGWARMLQQYTGMNPDLGPGAHPEVQAQVSDTPRFNFVVSQANTILPSVINTRPHFLVRPRRPADKRSAALGQHAVNGVWADTGSTKVVSRAVLDALLFGHGVVKVVYDAGDHVLAMPQFAGLLENSEPEMPPDQQRRLAEALGPAAGADLVDPKDNPRAVRVPPDRLLTPDGYSDLSQMPWLGEVLVMPLASLEADKRFKLPAGLKADVRVASTLREDSLVDQFHSNRRDSEVPDAVVIYEIRYYARTKKGLRRRVLYMLDERYGDVLPKDRVIRHVDDELRVTGYPYHVVRYVDVPDEFYSSSVADLAITANIAQKLNQVLAGTLKREKANSKNKLAILGEATEEGALDALLESDAEYAYAKVEGIDDVRKALMHLPKAPMAQDTPYVINTLTNLMYEVGGTTVFQRGGMARKGTTATEVAAAESHAGGRAAIRQAETEAFVAGIAKMFLEVMQQEWDRPRFIRVVNADGSTGQELVSSADIEGLLDVDVLVGSLQSADPAVEQNAWLGFLATVTQTMNAAVPLMEMGVLDKEQVRLWFDRTLEVWNQDRRELLGPMAQFQLMRSGADQGGQRLGMDAADGHRADEGGGALAGTGPRPGPGGIDLSTMFQGGGF